MPINAKTATAAIALMIAAGAYPVVGIAQDDTTSGDQNDSVQVEVIESDDSADADVTPGTETDADAADRTGDDTETTARDGKSDSVDTDQDTTSSDDAAGGDSATSADDSSSSGQDSTASSGDPEGDQATSGNEPGDGMDSTAGSDTAVETTTGTAAVTETDGEMTSDGMDNVQGDEVDQAVIAEQPAVSEDMLMETQDNNQWLSSDLTSKDVENPQGDKIGSVGGIIFSDDGPEGVIVEVGGFLGIGQKNVALRWSELTITDEAIIVDATKDELKDAPEFVSLEDQRRDSGAMFDDTAPMGTGGIDGEPAADGAIGTPDALGTPEQDTVQ